MANRSTVEETIDTLLAVAERARARGPLERADLQFVQRTAPEVLASFPEITPPNTIRHPGGFSVTGAPVGTFMKSALLLAGQKAFGRRFDGHPFYESVERDLAFNIMRSSFHHDYPKGTHCCVQCTLAVYPVLKAGAIRYFECAPLADDVYSLVRTRQWRFSRPVNATMIRWSLGDDA